MQRVPSCAYCFKPYAFKGSGRPVGQRIPRLLSCGHTFCDGCTTKLAEVRPRVLQCPTCKQDTVLAGGKKEIRNLPTNLYILGILINNIRATIEKDVTKGELSDFDIEKGFNTLVNTTPCGAPQEEDSGKVCDECCKDAAISKCQKCEALFCENCFDTVHSSSRTLRSHEAIPLFLTDLAGVPTQTCETHEGRELEFYDQTDQKLVCSLCILTPPYQGHNIVPANELTKEITEKLKQSLQNVEKVQACLKKSKGKLSSLFPKVKTECSEVVQDIREHFQDLHTKLQAREVSLIKEVKDAFCSKSFPAEVVKEITEQNKDLETLIKQGTAALSTPSIIMKIGETLLSKMADFEDIPCILSESFVQDLVKISYPKEFQNALNSYGEVVTESCSLKLKKISEQSDDTGVEDEAEGASALASNKSEDESNTDSSTTRSSGILLTMPPRQNLVHVTHVKNPCDFMVQHAADNERIENLMDAINNYCKAARSMNDAVRSTQVGDLLCAQYSKDQCWYRARVIGEQQRASVPKGRHQPLPKVEVYFIDYGNTELVPLDKLRKIRPEFADFPELATKCSLVDIVPPQPCNTWPAQSIKAFGSLIRDKALLMSVVKKSGGKLYVDLKSSEEEPTKDDDKPASVRDALVFLEVARFSSPASVANPAVAFPVRTYKKVALPEEGQTVQVTVTYTETPDALYVMRDCGKEYADTLRLIGQMSSMYSTTRGNQWQIIWPYKGLVCAARFSGDKVWYRALVTDVTADQIAQVLYVDFGNSEELPFSELRRIPDHMTQLPMQAIKCRLAGIHAVDEEKGWSDECCDFLSNTCSLNRYNMRVVEAESDQLIAVVLYEADVQRATSVNQQLVLNSYATLSGDVDNFEFQDEYAEEPSSPASNASTRTLDAIDNASSIDGDQGKLLFPKNLSYQPVEIPRTNKFQLAVSYVDEDCTICGYQLRNGDHSLPELMRLVQKICKDNEQPLVSQDQLSFNQPCCAEYSNDNLWYRALIVDFPTPSSVLVDYVDFGNRAEIPLTSVNLNAAFLDIPKQCLSIQLEGLPQTPVEQAKVANLLEGLLVGQTCEAVTSMKSTIDGVLRVDHLILPDGSDVVEAAGDMMLRQRERQEEQPTDQYPPRRLPPVRAQQGDREMATKIKRAPESGKSLLSDTVLPPEGIPFDVCVTQIDTKSVLFLQRERPTEDDPALSAGHDPTHHVACDHLGKLVDMANKINLLNYFKGKPNVSNVWSKMLCCARYTEDDLWYRAQVIKVMSNDPLEAHVLYVDYGTSEVIGLDRIKPFPAELLSLPKQAFQCSVVGLSDDGDDESDDQMDAVDYLSNAVAGRKLICKVVSSESSPVVVELYVRLFNEESYQDVPLGEALTELDLMMENADDDFSGTGVDSPINEQCGANEEKSAFEVEVEPDDDETEDFTADMEPLGDWYAECEESFTKYDREGMHTQLLTPAQFVLKKESSLDPEKFVKSKVQVESEVD